MSASRLKPATKRHNANISMAYGCDKDNNTYCYRLTNGHKHLHRIVLGYGWENIPFDVTKLSCYEPKEGEETMPKGRKSTEKPSNDELMAFAKKWHYINLTGRAKTEYHIGYETAKKWLTEAGLLAKQTPEPKGDQPDPAQETQEPANNSISEKGITVKDVLMYELEQKEAQYTPTDNDYSDEPQRTTMTRAQYDAMAMNDDRRSALSLFRENKAVEDLFQGWAVDVFKHVVLSRERKLELIGQLLDWRAGE